MSAAERASSGDIPFVTLSGGSHGRRHLSPTPGSLILHYTVGLKMRAECTIVSNINWEQIDKKNPCSALGTHSSVRTLLLEEQEVVVVEMVFKSVVLPQKTAYFLSITHPVKPWIDGDLFAFIASPSHQFASGRIIGLGMRQKRKTLHESKASWSV